MNKFLVFGFILSLQTPALAQKAYNFKFKKSETVKSTELGGPAPIIPTIGIPAPPFPSTGKLQNHRLSVFLGRSTQALNVSTGGFALGFDYQLLSQLYLGAQVIDSMSYRGQYSGGIFDSVDWALMGLFVPRKIKINEEGIIEPGLTFGILQTPGFEITHEDNRTYYDLVYSVVPFAGIAVRYRMKERYFVGLEKKFYRVPLAEAISDSTYFSRISAHLGMSF